MKSLVELVFILVTSLRAWVLGIPMRRRIRSTLGKRAANEMELTSLKTWIQVEEVEERRRGGKLS